MSQTPRGGAGIGAGRCRAGVACLVTVVAAGCSAAGPGGGLDVEVVEDVDARVEAAAESAEAGGVVARVDAPAGQHTVAVGPAGVRGDHRLSGDEAFRVGSITKMFTATVALQLVEDGAIELDAPVAEVVPEHAALFQHGAEVTLRQLLSHTAGLPGDVSPEFFQDAWDLGYIKVDDGVATVDCADVERHDRWGYVDGDAAFEPGTDWEYSNVGYQLVGEIIEAVTGQPLEDVYRERILAPLRMDDSWLDCPEDPRHELAGGFHPPHIDDLPGQDDAPFDVTMLARHAWAAGGLVSTAEDLSVFARALFGGELFDDEATLAAMLEPGPSRAYGLGLGLGGGSGAAIAGHSGSVAGYGSQLSYDVDRDIVIVVLSNKTPEPHHTPLATQVATAVHRVMPDDGTPRN